MEVEARMTPSEKYNMDMRAIIEKINISDKVSADSKQRAIAALIAYGKELEAAEAAELNT